jgi:hypothetical protein
MELPQLFLLLLHCTNYFKILFQIGYKKFKKLDWKFPPPVKLSGTDGCLRLARGAHVRDVVWIGGFRIVPVGLCFGVIFLRFTTNQRFF